MAAHRETLSDSVVTLITLLLDMLEKFRESSDDDDNNNRTDRFDNRNVIIMNLLLGSSGSSSNGGRSSGSSGSCCLCFCCCCCNINVPFQLYHDLLTRLLSLCLIPMRKKRLRA